MGRLSEKILSRFYDEFPELESLKVELDFKRLPFKKQNRVLPYLAFTNSMDKKRRMIEIIHSSYSPHHKILPFYITLAICKKEISRFESSSQIPTSDIVVLYKNKRCEIVRYDVQNQIIVLHDGSSTTKISFDEFLGPYIRSYHRTYDENFRKARDYFSLNRLSKAESLRKIFDIPKYIKEKPHSGVLLFTPKMKFLELLKSLRVNDVDVIKVIPTVNAKYNTKKKEYSYEWVSKTKKRYPLIVFTNYLDINAFDVFKRKFPHLDTVVFDEVESNFERINKSILDYKKKLDSQEIQDIYLLISDNHLDLTKKIDQKIETTSKWLSTSYDFRNQNEESKHFDIIIISDTNYNDALNESYETRLQFKRLFNQFDPSKVYPIYSKFCELLKRYTSFQNPSNYKKSIFNFIEEFEVFSESYLLNSSNLYDDFMKRVINSVESLYDNGLNIKLSELENYLKENSFDESKKNKIGIISRNQINEDRHYVKALFNSDNEIHFYTYKELKKEKKINDVEVLFILEFREPLSNSLFVNKFSEDQVIILSRKEFNYLRSKHYFVGSLVNQITSVQSRGEILNLKSEEMDKFIGKDPIYNIDLISHIYSGFAQTDEKPDKEYKNIQEIDFNDLIIGAYEERIDRKTSSDTTTSRVDQSNLLIIYKDGTQDFINENANVYHLHEDNINEINDLIIHAKDLMEGDDIIKIKTHNSLKNLLLDKLSKSSKFQEMYSNSETWRKSLVKLCDDVGFKTATRLISNHIKRNEATIRNWYTKDTHVPHSHLKVIQALNYISASKEDIDIPYIENARQVVKDASEIKGTLLSLPKTLLRISIRKLYDLPSSKDFDNEIDNLANQIFENVDIKTVQTIRYI